MSEAKFLLGTWQKRVLQCCEAMNSKDSWPLTQMGLARQLAEAIYMESASPEDYIQMMMNSFIMLEGAFIKGHDYEH